MINITNEIELCFKSICNEYDFYSTRLDNIIDNYIATLMGNLYDKFHVEKQNTYLPDGVILTIINHSILMTELKTKYDIPDTNDPVKKLQIIHSTNKWKFI